MRGWLGFSRRLARAGEGASAVEFALVAPAFITCMFGACYVCLMAFTSVGLTYAVEAAARCYSVKTTVCTNASTTQAFATSHFMGPVVTPTFVASTPACGHQVTGTVNFTMDLGISRQTFPVTASACAP